MNINGRDLLECIYPLFNYSCSVKKDLDKKFLPIGIIFIFHSFSYPPISGLIFMGQFCGTIKYLEKALVRSGMLNSNIVALLHLVNSFQHFHV